MLGNIKFIGELGKLDMLHEGILHRCIQQLLEKKTKAQSVQDMGEDFECLCQIMRTVGKALDHDKARLWMDQYFDRIRTIMSHPDLPPRIRFMLLDIVELRENQWIPRKSSMDTGPKTIQQVREEALREYGYSTPPTSAMASLSMNMDPFGRPMNGTIPPHKSMMGDIFGPMSPPYMGNSSLGTGPGVVDDFTPSFLTGNPGRPAFDIGFPGPYLSRGRQNDRRGGHNSPRFDRYSNQKTYHREKEADNDSDDDYVPRDRHAGHDSHFSYGDRYVNQETDRQQPSRYYNRNPPNHTQSMNYRNNDSRGYQPPSYSIRQRSPYSRDGPDDRRRDSGTPESENWRKEKIDDEPREERVREKRAYRPGIDDADLPAARNKCDERSRRDDWDRERNDKDLADEKESKPFREPLKRDCRNFDENDRPPTKEDPFDYDSYGHDQHPKKDHDWDYQKGWRNMGKDRDDSQDRRIYQNGDIRDHMDHDQGRDYRPGRDFGSNRDYGRDFRDGRDYHSSRDFRDSRGYGRDYDGRGGGGGFDRDRSGFPYHRGSSSGPPPQRDGQPPRELPPRFQRKQQQQQQQQQQQHQGQADLFTNEMPMSAADNGMPVMTHSPPPPPPVPPGGPPQRFRPPLPPGPRPPMPGYFPPRYPPPGGPPVRGPLPRGYPTGQIPPTMPRYPMAAPQGYDGPRDTGPGPLGGPGQPTAQNLPKGPAKPDEISLRPARNFSPMLRPSAPSMLPKSAQNPCLGPSHMQAMAGVDLLGPAQGPPSSGPQPVMKPTNLTIKQVSSADKKDKRKLPNKEQLKQAAEELIKKFIDSGNVEEAITAVKDLKPPRRFMPEMISMLIINGLERADADRESISKLILAMKEEGVLSSDLYMDALCNVLECMSELEQEIPLVKSNVAKFAAQAVGSEIISLAELSEPLQNGSHYPFFLLCLQQLHKVKDKEWLVKAFNESKIELLSMLPECDRTKERMVEILEDRSLSFMFPLLRVQSDLWRQIRSDPNPANIYKWIKENVDTNLQSDPGFIEILVTNVLKYIINETTLKPDTDHNNPDKAAIDKEKELLEKFKGVLQRFLLDKIDLQMVAIYAIQVLGYNRQFPKGLMLRMFMNMYDLEIIDEETFLKWKEEVNDEYPGKGQVLFQVNQWLTWLEQAEEEESEEEEN